jgi:hypothetical protein
LKEIIDHELHKKKKRKRTKGKQNDQHTGNKGKESMRKAHGRG